MIHASCVALAAALAVAPPQSGGPAGAGRAGCPPVADADSVGARAAPSAAGRVEVVPVPATGPRRLVRFADLESPDMLGEGGPAEAARVAADTPVARTRAIEHSDAYYTRLEIHRYGSYAMLPLFAGEYFLGQNLLTSFHPASWVRPTHRVVAYGVAGVFGVNTVTGVWNLWEARGDSNGRTRRMVHALSMLASDAGFVATGATAGQAKRTLDGAHRHRNIALASIGLSTASTVYMWLTR